MRGFVVRQIVRTIIILFIIPTLYIKYFLSVINEQLNDKKDIYYKFSESYSIKQV